jgi:hypothetical protein
MSERDMHFQGFARLLWEEMLSQTQWQGIDVTAGHIPLHHPEDEEHKTYIDLIARRTYDLVRHTLDTSGVYLHLEPLAPEYIADTDEIMKHISDLTQWPPET